MRARQGDALPAFDRFSEKRVFLTMKESRMPGSQPGGQPAQGWDESVGAERPMFATEPGDDQAAGLQGLAPGPGAPAPAPAPAGAEEQALLAEIEALRAELAEAEQRASSNHEQLLRASAEVENVRRRGREEVAKAQKFAIEGFAEELLPVCDSLEMALNVEVQTVDSFRAGVEATLRQLLQAFERNHLKVVDPLGQRFDPNQQQAIQMVPSADVPANHVVSVLQKGYLINERVLRPAMVMVSQGS